MKKVTEIDLNGYIVDAHYVYNPARIIVRKENDQEFDILMSDKSGTLELIHYDALYDITGKENKHLEPPPCEVCRITDAAGNVITTVIWKTWSINDVMDAIVDMAGRHTTEPQTLRDLEGFAVLKRRYRGRHIDVDAELSFNGVKKKDYVVTAIQPVAAMAFDQIEIFQHPDSNYVTPMGGGSAMDDVNGYLTKIMPVYPALSELGCSRLAQQLFTRHLAFCFVPVDTIDKYRTIHDVHRCYTIDEEG